MINVADQTSRHTRVHRSPVDNMVGMSRPVIFDLYNTLIDGADDERDGILREMASLLGVAPAALLRAYHESWQERLLGWGVEETIRIISGRLGIDPTDEQVVRAGALRRGLPGRLLAMVSDDTLAVLDRLRADGYPLGLVSNATAESAEAWPTTSLAKRFDVAIFSSAVGLAKPDPAIYELAAGRLGAKAAECVFVGDGSDDELAGAAAAGMTVFRTTEFRDTLPTWSGPVMDSLAELPELLGEPFPAR
jgi:putative hydrolase of the HAD superfamily